MFAGVRPDDDARRFSATSTGTAATDLGTEDKNGVRAVHFQIDPTTIVGIGALMPAGASIDVWIADDGLRRVAGDRPASRTAKPGDPGHQRERPGEQGRTPGLTLRPSPRSRAGFGRAHLLRAATGRVRGPDRRHGRPRREHEQRDRDDRLHVVQRSPMPASRRSARSPEADAERGHRRGIAIERRLVAREAGARPCPGSCRGPRGRR